MLNLFADCLFTLTRIGPSDARRRAREDRRREDEEWLQSRRAERFDERLR